MAIWLFSVTSGWKRSVFAHDSRNNFKSCIVCHHLSVWSVVWGLLKKMHFQILRDTYIRFSILFFCYVGSHVQNICLNCQPFCIFHLFLTDTKFRRVLVCFAICYRKKESILSECHEMRHLVIHSDSCGCLPPGVNSWLLHHDNETAHTSLLVRNFFDQ